MKDRAHAMSDLFRTEILAPAIGMVGDAISFTGALILALKEAGEEKKARELHDIVETFEKNPGMRRIEVSIEGIVIETERHIEIALSKRASRRARVGAVFLAIGFVFLFIGRLVEMLGVVHRPLSH
jgi:hypothetical protein